MSTLHDTELIARCITLASEIYEGHLRLNGEKWIEHPRRIAQRALLLDWPDFIVGACWLHDAFEVNPIDFDDVLIQIREFNEKVAFFVDKCAFRQWEHWSDYINRVSASPETRAIKWLEVLDDLSDCQQRSHMNKLLEALPKLTPDYFMDRSS